MTDLQCRDCGEFGTLHRDDTTFWVACSRGGKECCSTMHLVSEKAAIEHWDRLTSEPADEWLSDFEPATGAHRMSPVYVRYFGPVWVLLYHPRYWRTCVSSWPVLRRDFISIGFIEAGIGDAK